MGGKGSGESMLEYRKRRIECLRKLIKANPSYSKERIVAEFKLTHGTSRRTTLDYIKDLEITGKVKFN